MWALGISWILQDLGDWLEDRYFDGLQVVSLRTKLDSLLTRVRVKAVPLVDAFAFTDRQLRSALGCADGLVYDRLFDLAANCNPINKSQVAPGFVEHIQRFLHAKM